MIRQEFVELKCDIFINFTLLIRTMVHNFFFYVIGTKLKAPIHVEHNLAILDCVCLDLNPSLAEYDMPCLSKQCRSRLVGF